MLMVLTRGQQTLRQILRLSTTIAIITTKAMGHLMVGAVAITREMLKLSHSITMDIITRAMEATMVGCPIEASMAMARGMQNPTQSLSHSIIMVIISNHMEDMVSPITATMDMARGTLRLKQIRVTTKEMLMLILRHSITMDTTPRAMGEVIGATMAMARGLLNLMQMLILRLSITMAIIPRVMGEVMVIVITLQATGLPMAMARGMPRQKLKLSIPITSYIMQR